MPISGSNQIINVALNYKWFEEKTVNTNGNTINLNSVVPVGGRLRIVDKKYGQEWFEGQNWNRNGQTITLISNLPETLTFQIWCFSID